MTEEFKVEDVLKRLGKIKDFSKFVEQRIRTINDEIAVAVDMRDFTAASELNGRKNELIDWLKTYLDNEQIVKVK